MERCGQASEILSPQFLRSSSRRSPPTTKGLRSDIWRPRRFGLSRHKLAGRLVRHAAQRRMVRWKGQACGGRGRGWGQRLDADRLEALEALDRDSLLDAPPPHDSRRHRAGRHLSSRCATAARFLDRPLGADRHSGLAARPGCALSYCEGDTLMTGRARLLDFRDPRCGRFGRADRGLAASGRYLRLGPPRTLGKPEHHSAVAAHSLGSQHADP